MRELPDEVRARAPFEAWLSPLAVRGSQSSPLFEAVMLPLGSQQSHLVATMKLRIPSEDGHMISLSYAQATSVLKTSPDNRFRRSVFALFNAWFAEHSAAFADLLNAVLGWKLHEAHAAGRDFMTAAFEADRITPAAQLAMMKALELRRENARLTITERARLLGERQLHVTQILGSVEGMHASAPEGLNGLDEVCGSLSSAMACTDPGFGRYLEEALENHWIDARSMSQRAGGTWCEDLPAYNATAVFSTLPSGTAGAFQFAHPLGVGFMHKAQHGEQAPLKRLPYSVIEIFGQLAVTMLERHMARKLEGSTEADLLRWQLMRRASNMLLMVPSRHKLLVDLLAARRDGILSASRFNEASRRAWDAFFGGTTDGNLERSVAYERQAHAGRSGADIRRAMERGNRYAARILTWASAGDMRNIALLERCRQEGRNAPDTGRFAVCPNCGNLYPSEYADWYCPACLTEGKRFVLFE